MKVGLVLAATTLGVFVSGFSLAGATEEKSQTAMPSLFLNAVAPAAAIRPDTVVRHRPVRINSSLLLPARSQGALLNLNLFPDAAFIGRVDRIESRSESDYTLVGSLQGDDHSSFTLVVNGDVVLMNIRPAPEGLFEVRYLGDGIHEVRKADEKLFKPCLTGGEHAVSRPPVRPTTDARAKGGSPSEPDAGDYIDVMVVYTPAARPAVGGTAAMHALINLGIAESNTAYQQSGVAMRVRLVHRAEVAYTEPGSFSTTLNHLTDLGDGYLDEVHSLRDTYGADLVSFWINDTSSCGLAWMMSFLSPSFEGMGFSVVHWDCATGSYSFPHEMGHNMGCGHDRGNGLAGLDSYSYGWRFYGTNGVQYRTIMAYAPGTRIQRFSNPDVTYYGTPTGVAIGDPSESHNAQTINNSAYTIANFRQTVPTSDPPTIITPPASQSVIVGGDVTFSVAVEGTPPFAYQWRKNGDPIASATLSSYSLFGVQTNDAGAYSVTVTNEFGSTNSDPAALTVNLPVTLAEALDATDLVWTSGGAAGWSGETGTTHDGIDAAASGVIDDSQESWVETTVTGPGVLTFWWKVSSEASFDLLRFARNGAEQFNISGEVGWQQRNVSIPSGDQTLRWRYTKDSSEGFGTDQGWLDQVVFTPQTLAVALDNSGLSWTTGGGASWSYQTSVTHDGVDAAASGTVLDDQFSLLQTTVQGPGTLRFWWKVSSELDYDYLLLGVDGYVSNYISGEVGWTQVSQVIPPGNHSVQWEYSKDVSDYSGSDKGWVDQVVYVAPSTVVSNYVQAGPPRAFVLQVEGAIGASYTLQASTFLTNWVTLTNVTATSLPVTFVDSSFSSYPHRFYRVVSP